MTEIAWLGPDPDFPDPELALSDPNGLLAAGGDLSTDRLIAAYRQGIFPWFDENQPPLWWSPDPRCVMYPDRVHISKSLKKALRRDDYQLSFDHCFEAVIHYCASSREQTSGTWITPEMHEAYCQLHDQGIAHSVEVWNRDNKLVGGLYGLSMGCCFFGESMFSFESNTSKMAFTFLAIQLQQSGFAIIDCQVENPHLFSLGAHTLTRSDFLKIVKTNIDKPPKNLPWQNKNRIPSATIVERVMKKMKN